MICLDFTAPETFRKLAELPYYGWAEALIRRVDPLWKYPIDGPLVFGVKLVKDGGRCQSCGCDCCPRDEVMTVEIEAADADDAERMAERENKGWFAVGAELPKVAQATVPPEYLAWFEKPESVQ